MNTTTPMNTTASMNTTAPINTTAPMNTTVTPNYDELKSIVDAMKLKENKLQRTNIMEKIHKEPTLTGKCILGRSLLTPQSTDMESICRHDLHIGKPIDETSGDGSKNGLNYEIKISVHARDSKLNFVQIRPDHNVDYYILIGYNMYADDELGKAHIFKIPSDALYDLVIQYGGYAHGTNSELGVINHDTLKGRNCEYALRCNPNATTGKNALLWNTMLTYEVPYEPSYF